MDPGHTAKMKYKFWYSELEYVIYFMNLIHMKQFYFYTNSNLAHLGSWLRLEIIFWFFTTLQLFDSSSTPLCWLYDIRNIEYFQSFLSIRYLSNQFQNFFFYYSPFPSTLLFFPFLSIPSIHVNRRTRVYQIIRVKCLFQSEPSIANLLCGGNWNKRVTCVLYHRQAPCEAVHKNDRVLKHRCRKRIANVMRGQALVESL